MHSLYEEGLIDVEWPVNKGENIDQKFTTGKAAARHLGWVLHAHRHRPAGDHRR